MKNEEQILDRIRGLKELKSGIMSKYFIVYEDERKRELLIHDNMKIDQMINELEWVIDYVNRKNKNG